jgi:hypothetical protein
MSGMAIGAPLQAGAAGPGRSLRQYLRRSAGRISAALQAALTSYGNAVLDENGELIPYRWWFD